MRERVHINIHIFICVDSYTWRKCQEFGFPLFVRWNRVLLRAGREGGVEIPSRNVDMKASRAIPGAVRTFAPSVSDGIS